MVSASEVTARPDLQALLRKQRCAEGRRSLLLFSPSSGHYYYLVLWDAEETIRLFGPLPERAGCWLPVAETVEADLQVTESPTL